MTIRWELGLLASFAFLLDFLLVAPATAADVPLPTGSYLQSCKVVSFNRDTGDLSASCDGPAVGMFGLGTPETSTFNVKGCREGTIWNDRRQLYCFADSAWGNDRVIPKGSYIETCTDRKIIGGALLTAVCDNGNGVPNNASVDLRNCQWGADISNSGGRLLCLSNSPGMAVSRMSGSLLGGQSGAGVAKPVTVEPGVVKPALLAPAPPAGEGPAGEDSASKKKKKRREPGQRG